MIPTLLEFFRRMAIACDTFDRWAGGYMPDATVDHIGHKCASTEEFEGIRGMLEPFCHLQQSWLSGRRVAILEFAQDIVYLKDSGGRPANLTLLGALRFIELSDQKPDRSQRAGFDHIEIYPNSGTPAELAAALTKMDPRNAFAPPKRAHHATYDLAIAPTLEVRIEPGPLADKIDEERRKRR